MDIADVRLVLDKEVGAANLADVVEIAADPGQHRVSPHRFGRRLGEIGRHDRMVVRSWRADHQSLQQRIVGRRQLQQPDRGDHLGDLAEERQGTGGDQR